METLALNELGPQVSGSGVTVSVGGFGLSRAGKAMMVTEPSALWQPP